MPRLAVRRVGRHPRRATVACLHGVTAHRAFRAVSRSGSRHGSTSVAPDLVGHGDSPYEPPWSIEAHLAAIAEALRRRTAALGGSFVRWPARLRARGGIAGLGRAARAARPGDPPPGPRRPLRRRERARERGRTGPRGGDRPALRREPAPRRAARAARGRAPPASSSPRRRRWRYRYCAGRRRDRVRRAGGGATGLRRRAGTDPARARGATRTSRTTTSSTRIATRRRPPRGRQGARRTHRALGRAGRDGCGGRGFSRAHVEIQALHGRPYG